MYIRISEGSAIEFPYGHMSKENKEFLKSNVGKKFEVEIYNMNFYKIIENGFLIHQYNTSTVYIMKRVLLPIVVPDTNYCWDGHVVCEYFDNSECASGECKLGFSIQDRDRNSNFPKPEDCKQLQTQDK